MSFTLRVEHLPGVLRIYRVGRADPIIVQHAESNKRPYIHPIAAPDGKGILTEDAPSHHPWQHGLYIGLNAVNGIGFWSEGLGGNKDQDGSFHPLPIEHFQAAGNEASWTVHTEWRDPSGSPMLQEEQTWSFTDRGDYYELDLNWRLTAEIDLTFGQYPYGGLFLRMPFRKETGGDVYSSEGRRSTDAEGQRARWVAVSMPIEGREGPAGIAILDHAGNREHPVPWRVDGQLGIGPSCCIAGEWKLAKGESRTFKYRAVVFCGQIKASFIEQAWKSFCGR
ncbi:hypothetical protein FE783_14895 [Paenibacillus mesophilus]|uniref:DUF6807 domain-containing protein n=1 Tax=Paenibacillus mesophilus TaxID=2582849 RepID=UPI00110F1975|nr:PmoA family protein [Paenibacillus mesophilus]TMV48957.1 hypothetical protein FE783_14895 [Paenibacillus mesophilus]